MTRLFAEIKDFKLIWHGDEVAAYQFRFAECEDFADAMTRFKAIPLNERTPYPVQHHANALHLV